MFKARAMRYVSSLPKLREIENGREPLADFIQNGHFTQARLRVVIQLGILQRNDGLRGQLVDEVERRSDRSGPLPGFPD